MRKLAYSLLIPALGLLFLFTPKTAAAQEFETSYQTTYKVEEDGEVKVTQNVTTTNLTSQYFVSQYKFTIGSEKPKNIKAWDPSGSLNPQINREDGKTNITVKFKSRVVGKGNKLDFGISYDFPGIARKNGLLWEVSLLKISGLDDIQNYSLTLSVPQSFGPLLYQSPKPSSQTTKGERTFITYTKNKLKQGAPRLGFGEFQLYDVSLSYHLKNPSITLGYTEIALPPDVSGYQKVIQNSLLPSPDSIRVDEDGNYLARYDLGPLEQIDVTWEGAIALFYPSKPKGGKIEEISQTLVEKYTQEEKYWETTAVEIKAQAAKLTNPKLSVAKNLENIYNFTTGKLSYNYERLQSGELERLGALAALNQKDNAVCMEYTDLFIALTRSYGVPAREVNGYAYTTDEEDRPLSLRIEGGDVLHAWPQVYTPKSGWVMVDPTWGSTSGSDYFSQFDLSHLTFVIKGDSSEYPLPAGSYKTSPNQKDVKVEFSTQKDLASEGPNLQVEVSYPLYIISPFTSEAEVKITNTGKATAFNTTLNLQSNLLSPTQSEFEVGTIPPGATVSQKVSLQSENALTRGTQTLLAQVNTQTFQENSLEFEGEGSKNVRPLYLPLGWKEVAMVLLGAGVIVLGRRFLLTRLTSS